MVYVCLVLYNEEWDIIMFQEYYQLGVGMLVFRIICVTIGVVSLSNYLMAFLVNEWIHELEKADEQELKKKYKVEKAEIKRKLQHQ